MAVLESNPQPSFRDDCDAREWFNFAAFRLECG